MDCKVAIYSNVSLPGSPSISRNASMRSTGSSMTVNSSVVEAAIEAHRQRQIEEIKEGNFKIEADSKQICLVNKGQNEIKNCLRMIN